MNHSFTTHLNWIKIEKEKIFTLERNFSDKSDHLHIFFFYLRQIELNGFHY